MKKFPRQRLSFKEKSANNFRWAHDTIDSIVSQHIVDPTAGNFLRTEYNRKLSNYQLFNNILNQADFERECNPFGIEVGQFKDTVQPYNKTYNKIQVLLGDELQRPFHYKAVLTNAEGVKSKLAHRDMLLRQFVYAKIQETISQISQNYDKQLVDEALPNIMSPEEIDKMMKTSYLDSREILGNKILAYLFKALGIKSKKNEAFKHALIAGEEFVYVGEENGNPVLEILNPLGVFYHKSPDVRFIQDSLYAGYRTYMTSGEVLDQFGDYLTEEEAKKIDSTFEGKFGIRSDFIGPTMKYGHDDFSYLDYWNHTQFDGQYSSADQDDHLVYHVEWRSQRKVGFLTFTNEFGDEQTELVSEDFDMLPKAYEVVRTKGVYGRNITTYEWDDLMGNHFSLEWKWVPEIWSGVRIDSDIYVMVGPKQYQFRSMDDPYNIKLGYHGVVMSSTNAPSVSLMDRMKPFQYLYFLVMHKLKKLIAQDQGKVFHFDISMVDPKVGLEKTLYYLKELNIDFFNPLENADMPGQNQRGKVHGSTDWSNMQNILSYVQLLSALDAQISDVAGVNRQREGQVSATEAVTNAQSNIAMSALITEIFFDAHQTLWEQVLESLLQTATQCFRGKKIFKQYILDDMSLATLEMSPESLDNAQLGIFVSNSMQDKAMFDALRNMGEALTRANKASFSDLINLYSSISAEELKREIRSSEEAAMKMQQEQLQQQLQAQEQEQARQHAFEMQKLGIETDTKIKVAEIQSFAFQKDQDVNNNQVPDQLEIAKFRHEAQMDEKDHELAEKKLELDKQKVEIQRSSANKKTT